MPTSKGSGATSPPGYSPATASRVATSPAALPTRGVPSGRREKGDRIVGADDNIKTIQGIYEAFGRGDVQAVLDCVSDDVDWAAEASSAGAPWYGVRHGKAGVASFFEAFGST